MQAQVEELDGLERQLTFQVPEEKVDQEIHSRLVSLSKRARIDGFRPGKVPVKVVKRLYGNQIRQEVLGDLLKSGLEDAIKEKALRIAGQPAIESIKADKGEPLEFKARFEVFPEFEPAGIAGATVTRLHAEIVETDVDNMIERLRQQKVEYRAVDRAAQRDDQVKLTYDGSVDGESFASAQDEPVPMVLKPDAAMPEFIGQLTGLVKGSETAFDLTLPESYRDPNLAGKLAHFEVQIHEVGEPVLPVVDEAFAKEFGVTEGGVDALRSLLRKNMENQLNVRIEADVKRQVMDLVLQRNEFPVPQTLVHHEIDVLARESQFGDLEANENQAPDQAKQIQELKEKLFTENATQRVKLGLAVSTLVRENGIEISGEDIRAQLERLAQDYDDSDAFMDYYRRDEQAMDSVRTLAMEARVVEWLLDQATVEQKSMNFDELMSATEANKGA